MTREEFEEAEAKIYAHAKWLEENSDCADPKDHAQCYKEWALDALYDEYYGAD